MFVSHLLSCPWQCRGATDPGKAAGTAGSPAPRACGGVCARVAVAAGSAASAAPARAPWERRRAACSAGTSRAPERSLAVSEVVKHAGHVQR